MIADFIIERIRAYVSGGMSAGTAARFARGELSAIYMGRHYSRNTSGAMRVTPPPEAIGIEAAMRKADVTLAGILKESGVRQAPDNAPKATPWAAKKNGLEGLKNYARGNTL